MKPYLLFLAGSALVSVVSSTLAGPLAGPVTNSVNGHVYYLTTATSWAGAEAEAVALGGHLATINDPAENSWIYNRFTAYGGVYRNLWIGLSDFRIEGTFEWANGEITTYRNWSNGEPNNYRGNEDHAFMWSPADRRAGQWTDGSATGYSGIVEVVPGTASQLTILPALEIRWAGQTTNRYQAQWTSSLSSNGWINFGTPIQGTGSTNSIFDSRENGASHYYRVVTLPNDP